MARPVERAKKSMPSGLYSCKRWTESLCPSKIPSIVVAPPCKECPRALGALDPARMAATVRVIAGAYGLNKPASPEKMWAAGFVP
jgi:hypothetical protein